MKQILLSYLLSVTALVVNLTPQPSYQVSKNRRLRSTQSEVPLTPSSLGYTYVGPIKMGENRQEL